MLRTHRLSSRSTARNAPKAAESAPPQPARWPTCTRARGPWNPWRIIGIGIGAGIGIGMGIGNTSGCQDHPQALPIACAASSHTVESDVSRRARTRATRAESGRASHERSEEHTSELQSLRHLVCRLLLEKKKDD